MISTTRTPRLRRFRHVGLALLLGLVAARATASDDHHGGLIQTYDPASGTLVVDGRKAHVGPATKLFGYGKERISAIDLRPGMSVSYEVRPTTDQGIPEIVALELIPN